MSETVTIRLDLALADIREVLDTGMREHRIHFIQQDGQFLQALPPDECAQVIDDIARKIAHRLLHSK